MKNQSFHRVYKKTSDIKCAKVFLCENYFVPEQEKKVALLYQKVYLWLKRVPQSR